MITLIAAGWCAVTMFQSIDTDARAEAIAKAQETPAYLFAQNAANTARDLLQDRLRRPEARPTCNCPQTVAAWESAEAAAINRLRHERDTAVAQMQAAIPTPTLNWLAVARGAGVEIAKLFGFTVFWLAVAPLTRAQPPARQPFEVLEGGRSTAHPPAAQPARAGRALFAGVLGWWAVQTQQSQAVTGPPSNPKVAAQPVEHVGDLVLEKDLVPAAEALAALRVGERAIAVQLSARSGQFVSRWQVRKMLGRVAA